MGSVRSHTRVPEFFFVVVPGSVLTVYSTKSSTSLFVGSVTRVCIVCFIENRFRIGDVYRVDSINASFVGVFFFICDCSCCCSGCCCCSCGGGGGGGCSIGFF